MNILHISDIHFRKVYEKRENGYKGMLYCMQSPLIPLEYSLKKAQKQAIIDLVIISGDLTEDGEVEDYAFLREFIENIIGETKIIVTLGNHDNKANFRKGWLKIKETSQPYNYMEFFESFCVISVDSSSEKNPNGVLGKEQLIWLEQAFVKAEEQPVILVTHHHLLKNQSSMPPMQEVDKFLEVIKDKNIICILNGHTHHHYTGKVVDKAYYTVDSMSFCGEDEEYGSVRFEEKYGYNIYQIINGEIKKEFIETFETGKILKTIKMN